MPVAGGFVKQDFTGRHERDQFGAGLFFAFAALMAVANSAFALSIPKPRHGTKLTIQE